MKLVGPSLHVGELQRICLPVIVNNFSLLHCASGKSHKSFTIL